MAFHSSVLIGPGFGFFGFTGSLHVIKAKLSSKDHLQFTITAVTGPNGGPPMSAVHADGAALCLVPRNQAETEEFFRVAGDIMFGDGEEPGIDCQLRLKLMAYYEGFARTFHRRATDLLGSMGDGPWHGHPHKCALWVWINMFLLLHRAMAHTMLVDKDPSKLTENLDRMWGLASQSNMFTNDPSSISPRELRAALQLAGLSCETCRTAGALPQLCWKCKRNTSRGSHEERRRQFPPGAASLAEGRRSAGLAVRRGAWGEVPGITGGQGVPGQSAETQGSRLRRLHVVAPQQSQQGSAPPHWGLLAVQVRTWSAGLCGSSPPV